MRLASTIEALQKRPLTTAELATLNEFQRTFEIDDDDPLVVVLAMMARTQIAVDSVPNILQQKVDETIELHRTVLREQSTLIAKELLQDIYVQIHSQIRKMNDKEDSGKFLSFAENADFKVLWLKYLLFFIGGMFFSATILWARFWS